MNVYHLRKYLWNGNYQIFIPFQNQKLGVVNWLIHVLPNICDTLLNHLDDTMVPDSLPPVIKEICENFVTNLKNHRRKVFHKNSTTIKTGRNSCRYHNGNPYHFE